MNQPNLRASNAFILSSKIVTICLVGFFSFPAKAIDIPFNIYDSGVAKQSRLWTVGTSDVRASSRHLGNTIDAVRFGAVQEYALTDTGALTAEARRDIDELVQRLRSLNELNQAADPENYREIREVTLMASSAESKVHPYYVNGDTIRVGRWRDMFIAYVNYVEDVHGLRVRLIEPGNETDYGRKYNNRSNWARIHRVFNNDPILSRYPIVGPSTLSAGAAHRWYDQVGEDTDWVATHVINGTMAQYIRFLRRSVSDNKPYFASENHSLAEMIICANYADCLGGLWWSTSQDKGDWSRVSRWGRQIAYAEDRPNWTVATVYKQRRQNKAWIFASGGTRATARNAVPTTYRFISEGQDVYFDGVGPQRSIEITVGKSDTHAIEVTWD